MKTKLKLRANNIGDIGAKKLGDLFSKNQNLTNITIGLR